MNGVVIVAAGTGSRMNMGINKQFIKLEGKEIIAYTIEKFYNNSNIEDIVVVVKEDESEFFKKEILDKYNFKNVKIAYGGKERQDSVYNALEKLTDDEIVLIHDGARPFVSERIIEQGIKYAGIYGAAAPGVMPKDTIKIKDENGLSLSTPDRNALVAIQTPQVFKLNIIKECHRRIKEEKRIVTDDTMVVEAYDNKVFLYEGDYTNIKVTTPEDLILAERLI